jgi:hypothetical protein
MTEAARMPRSYAASHPVIRLSSAGMTWFWGLYSGRFYALGWGDDPRAAYESLTRNAVLYDAPERPIEITGPQAP